MEISEMAQAMVQIFAPDPDSYGTYPAELTPSVDSPGKLESPMKGTTIKKKWSLAQIENHIQGIGVRFGCVPINNETGTIRFMAVDVDKDAVGQSIYNVIDLPKLAKRLFQIHPMLFVLRSKSGGPHIYAFFREDVHSGLVRPKMREIMSVLGWGTTHEYFPKQDKIDLANAEFGNWINLPYYGATNEEQPPLQYSFNPDTGEALSLVDFIGHVQLRAGTKDDLLGINLAGNEIITDGPPCMQRIFGEHVEMNRNVVISNLAHYLKQKNPDKWAEDMREYNARYTEPLSSHEMEQIIRSYAKKDYRYGCESEPLKSYCNKPLCNTRRYGYNSGSSHPFITSLTKHNSEPPLWWIYFDNGSKMRCNTDDLQNSRGFQRRAMEQLNSVPPILKQDVWTKMLQELMKKVTVVEVPESATQVGMMKQYIYDYLTGAAPGETMEDVMSHKPVLIDGEFRFSLVELMGFLRKKSFDLAKPDFITMVLGDMGAKYRTYKIAKTSRVLYSIPSSEIEGFNEELPMPELVKPTTY